MLPSAYPIQFAALEQTWQVYVATGRLVPIPGFVPDPTVIQSWGRCLPRFDAYSKPRPSPAKDHAIETVLKTHADLLTIAISYIEDIHQFIEGSNCALLLADGAARVIAIGGDRRAIAMIEALGLGQGAYWTEGKAGTNALGMVLITAMPSQVVGAEHFFQIYHHLVSTAAPIHDVNGRITGIFAVVGLCETATSHTVSMVMAAARAISNQLQANHYLAEANRRLTEANTVLNAMHEGVLAWDETGRINQINPQAAEMFGLAPAKVLGMPLPDVLSIPPVIDNAIKNNETLRDVEVHFERQQASINAVVSLSPIVEGAAHDQPVGYTAILRPIEQVRQLVSKQVGTQASLTLTDIPAASSPMRQVLRQATIAARGHAPVLLRGEGGVGKNSLGRAIHNASERADKPFLTINCGAIPHELMVSEFLGYEPDAATQGRPSKFELAHEGTLLLDQIANLSLEMQSALLHVIESKHIMRLQSTRLIPVDVRIIACTSVDLAQMVTEGSFLRPLYYAFGIFNFHVLPLRERKEDIAVLAERFLSRIAPNPSHPPVIDADAMIALQRYPWPGNVRELENVLERALHQSADGVIRVVDWPEVVRSGRLLGASSPIPQPIITAAEAEREAIIRAGWACRGCVTEMAKHLEMGRTTLWRKLKRLNISPQQFKR
jgi:transcriptional activator for dhaKLM operon